MNSEAELRLLSLVGRAESKKGDRKWTVGRCSSAEPGCPGAGGVSVPKLRLLLAPASWETWGGDLSRPQLPLSLHVPVPQGFPPAVPLTHRLGVPIICSHSPGDFAEYLAQLQLINHDINCRRTFFFWKESKLLEGPD